MAGQVVTLTYRAELTDLRKKLASIPGITAAEARQAVREINKTIRAAERSTDSLATGSHAAAKGLRGTSGAAANLNAQLFDIGVGLQGGQNPLTILAQQGPQIAQVFMGGASAASILKGALTSLVAVVGPAVTVIGGGTLAWKLYNAESERSDRLTQQQADALERLTPLVDMAEAATLRLKVATGELTKAQAAQIAVSQQSFKAYQSATEDTTARIAELRKEQGSVVTQFVDLGEKILDVVDVAGVNSWVFGRLTTSSADLGEELGDLTGVQDRAINLLRRASEDAGEAIKLDESAADAKRRLAEATKAAAKAHREWAAAWRESLALMDEDTRLNQEHVSALDQLRDMARSVTESRLEGYGAIAAAQDRELRNATALLQQANAAAAAGSAGDRQRLDARDAFKAAELAIDQKYDEERLRLADETKKAIEQKAKDEARAISNAYGSAYSQIAGATVMAAEAMAEGFADSNKEAARAAIGVAKAAGVIQVAIDTSLAVSNVNAAWAAAPPVAAALSAAAIAVGAVQAGIIASQPVTFHAGGIAGGTTTHSDEVQATLLRGEPVLTRQAGDMLGERGVNDLNAGRMPGPSRIVLEQRYGQSVFGAIVYDAARNPTTSLHRALKGRTKVGSNL